MCNQQRASLIIQIAVPYFQQAHEQGLTKLVDPNRNIWQLNLGLYQITYAQPLLTEKSLTVEVKGRGCLFMLQRSGDQTQIHIQQLITQKDVQWFLHLGETKPQDFQQRRTHRRRRGRQRQLQI
ncbi:MULTISPECIES: hypothetical protein [Cyanophyceae]|uniref:hypothetical protein n=1 Tax=Cyanophyceae TaxID=3028117 RepID=UPI0002A66EE9|nr:MULTISPECIES: hypothetical protein [Cyanophyceae]AFZ33544.1 hypothetical protein Glo7428_5161 [Gloeocapsa sp. PCC 7428]PPS42049.1 hypothetical protein B1A85_16440 [Chroococcidiopsis sp. TS-821]